MSDSKISALPAASSLISTDIIPVVTDPPGFPVNKQITASNLATTILSLGTATDLPISGAGKGIVITTPDGLHTYRLSIDNNGVITTEQLS